VIGPKVSFKEASAGMGRVRPEFIRIKEFTVSNEQVMG
jgi:hypothetical protein